MLFSLRNEDNVLKLLTVVFPDRTTYQDGKVLHKWLGKVSADRERRGQSADRAKPKRGAKEVRGKGENQTS